jgi:hypothetical protein
VYYAPAFRGPGLPGVPVTQVPQIWPAYQCNAIATAAGDLPPSYYVPAPIWQGPHASINASMDAVGNVSASANPVVGGTPPYTYWWSSSSTPVYGPFLSSVAYTSSARIGGAAEILHLTIEDANGYTGPTTSVNLGTIPIVNNPPSDASNLGIGIESSLDDWPSTMQTANDLHQISNDNNLFVNFDWRGKLAWDSDFEFANNNDSKFVDSTDDVWYNGHGAPGFITFSNSNHNNGSADTSTMKLGDGDLEWLQLWSCLTLRDTSATDSYNGNGTHDEFTRWKPVFQGLHQVNGYATNAYGSFQYGKIFADDILGVNDDATTIVQGWQDAALQTQPAGTLVRSIGPIGPGFTWDWQDHIPGHGSFGPDIANNQIVSFWSVTAKS